MADRIVQPKVLASTNPDTYDNLIMQQAQNATNVTTNINGNAISDIFESNGTIVKNATNAASATNGIFTENFSSFSDFYEWYSSQDFYLLVIHFEINPAKTVNTYQVVISDDNVSVIHNGGGYKLDSFDFINNLCRFEIRQEISPPVVNIYDSGTGTCSITANGITISGEWTLIDTSSPVTVTTSHFGVTLTSSDTMSITASYFKE